MSTHIPSVISPLSGSESKCPVPMMYIENIIECNDDAYCIKLCTFYIFLLLFYLNLFVAIF